MDNNINFKLVFVGIISIGLLVGGIFYIENNIEEIVLGEYVNSTPPENFALSSFFK